MKTFIAATFASVAVAVWANSFSPVIGVTKITATSQNTIIPIPYTSLTNSANNVTLADLVRTTGLPKGTWLLAFDGDKYEAWTLKEDGGSWIPGTYASTNMGGTRVAPGANTKEFAPGGAFWIVLPEPEEGESINQTIYVYGSYSDEVKFTVPAGKTMLVANPKQGAATPVVEGAVAKKDQMVCIKSGVVTTYTYDGTVWGCWVTEKTDGKNYLKFSEGLPKLEVGEGFWYKSKKTNASENEVVTINWTSVQD